MLRYAAAKRADVYDAVLGAARAHYSQSCSKSMSAAELDGVLRAGLHVALLRAEGADGRDPLEALAAALVAKRE